jgi:hypothetical protein
MRRVNRTHPASHEPVEQHADAGEMLLDGRRRHAPAELLYISGDIDRRDFIEPTDPLLLAPVEKFTGGAAISRTRVRVADVDCEEIEEAELGLLPRRGDECRHRSPCPAMFLFPMTTSSPMPGPYHRACRFTRT